MKSRTVSGSHHLYSVASPRRFQLFVGGVPAQNLPVPHLRGFLRDCSIATSDLSYIHVVPLNVLCRWVTFLLHPFGATTDVRVHGTPVCRGKDWTFTICQPLKLQGRGTHRKTRRGGSKLSTSRPWITSIGLNSVTLTIDTPEDERLPFFFDSLCLNYFFNPYCL